MSQASRLPRMEDYLTLNYVGDPACCGSLGLIAWTGSHWNQELPFHMRRFREVIHLADMRDKTLFDIRTISAGGDVEHSPHILPDGTVIFLSNAATWDAILEHGTIEGRFENQYLNAQQLFAWNNGKVRQLTTMLHGVNSYLVSPDGGNILFASWQYEGDTKEDLLRSPTSVERIRLALERQKAPSLFKRQRYKSDAEYGYCSDRSETLWLLRLDTGRVQLLLGSGDDFSAPCWLDSNRVLLQTSDSDQRVQFHCIDIQSEPFMARKLARVTNVRTCYEEDAHAVISADGRTILFAGNKPADEYPEPRGLYAIDADAQGDTQARRLIDLQKDKDGILPQDMNFACRDHIEREYIAHVDGCCYYTTGVDGDVRIARASCTAKGAEPYLVTAPLMNCHSLTAWDESTLLALCSTPESLPELALIDLPTGSTTFLTHSNPQLDDVAMPRFAKVYSSTGIQGFYYPPVRKTEDGRAPVIVSAHGGPTGFYCSSLNYEMACLAAEGFGVLCPNPRGGTGFGRENSKDSMAWDGTAMNDIILLLDELCLEHPELDHRRVGICGGSYGGYMTLWAAAHSHRFKAASAIRPLAHMSMTAASSQHAQGNSREEFPAYIDKLRSEISESPCAYIDKVRIPLQILQSVFDVNCVPEEALQIYKSMQDENPDIPCRLVLYPDSNHGLLYRGPAELALQQRLDNLEWFQKYL